MHDELAQGDHVCVLYETEEEQLTLAAHYLAQGLRRGEQCIYVGETRAAVDRFNDRLRRTGIDPDASIERRALIQVTHADVYLADGAFDCDRLLQLLDTTLESALKDGFVALRTCGEMSWLLEDAPGSEQLVEYEALLNQFFRNARAAGLCQYDRRRLNPTILDHALATHPDVVIQGMRRTNPFYTTFQDAVTRQPQPNWIEGKLRRLCKG